MKFVCDGLDLCDAVLKVGKAASSKSTNPLLEGIKIEAQEDYVKLTATDLELSLEKKIRADVQIEGSTVVPGKYFSDFVRKLNKEQIELHLNDKNQLKIKYMDSEGYLQCMSAAEYPRIEKIEGENSFSIAEKEFKDLINKTVFAVAVDDARPYLRGVLLEMEGSELTAVALDGYRLSMVKKQLGGEVSPMKLIVPARSLLEIGKMIADSEEESVQVAVQKNYIMVDLNHTTLISRLIDGDFIKYKQIIPTEFTSVVTVNKAQLEDGLERASILSNNPKNNLVKFDVREKVLTLSSNSEIGNVKENIAVSLDGKDMLIAFNARYFSEALRTTGDEFIKIFFNSPVAPCVIKPADGQEYLFLILPVRIVN